MNTAFPRILSLLRKERGLSQKQAAGQLGISQALLSHYEKGIRECGLDFLVRAANFYGVSCDYLLGRSPERTGMTLTVADIPKGAALGAIQSVEKTSGGIRVRFYDKLKALELLGKATGLFEGLAQEESGNLLEAIVGATEQEVDMDDLQEFQ